MDQETPVSRLDLRTVLPDAADTWPSAAVRPLVDGRDVLARAHPGGRSSSYQYLWFGPPESWPLWAAEEPRRVVLSNNDCDPGCCGGVFVTVRRRGPHVEWVDWENTHDVRAALPAEVRFDAVRYDAELARSAADHDWEEPVDTAARLLARRTAENGWYERWGCTPYVNGVQVRERGASAAVVMHFAVGPSGAGDSGRWHLLPLAPGEPVEDQVASFVEWITANDPRDTAAGR
ncbi:hypothetical protein [Streptomyces sp. NPDC090025]|uniref:hypothetical protein n=1 Tax=Streptomyces sp. NPDC090025 TaxID=3365922 RepID=UPI003834A2A1